MSDILIKNMEMPKSCITGKLPYYEYCPCFGGCSNASAKTERPSDCPLVEVPPHGRLIDVDKLLEEHPRISPKYPSETFYENLDIFNMLDDAPTVIEASTEETK